MARTVGFEVVDEASVEELFQSHMTEFSNENISGAGERTK
jgi:hypothetical protein